MMAKARRRSARFRMNTMPAAPSNINTAKPSSIFVSPPTSIAVRLELISRSAPPMSETLQTRCRSQGRLRPRRKPRRIAAAAQQNHLRGARAGLLRDIGGIGDQEGIPRRRRKFPHDADEAERHHVILVIRGVQQAKVDLVAAAGADSPGPFPRRPGFRPGSPPGTPASRRHCRSGNRRRTCASPRRSRAGSMP